LEPFHRAFSPPDPRGRPLAAKGKAGVLADVTVTVGLRDEKASHWPFGSPDRRSRFEPQRVAIEDANGKVLEELLQPRASFEGHAATWSDLQLAYFAGYAMWTYLNIPFLLARPGVESEEVEPWQESGETWRRLKVRFPADIATHSTEQTLYFDQQGLLRKQDYNVEIDGTAGTAHYVYDHKEFSGIAFRQKASLPSTTGRTPRSRTVDYLHRPRSDCPRLDRTIRH
jgi:hypothetical protein